MGIFCLFTYSGLADRFGRAPGFLYNLASLFMLIRSEKTTCWFWKIFYMMKNKSNFQNKNVGSALNKWTKKWRKFTKFRQYVATTPVWVEITRNQYSRGVRNLCRKLESDQCRQVLPIDGSWHVKHVLFCVDGIGGQVPHRSMVSKFMPSIKCFGLLPQVHAQQAASVFWIS